MKGETDRNPICHPKCFQTPFHSLLFAQISVPFPLLLWFGVQWHQCHWPKSLASSEIKQGKPTFHFASSRSLKWASAIKAIVNSLSNSHIREHSSIHSLIQVIQIQDHSNPFWARIQQLDESTLNKDSSVDESTLGLCQLWPQVLLHFTTFKARYKFISLRQLCPKNTKFIMTFFHVF